MFWIFFSSVFERLPAIVLGILTTSKEFAVLAGGLACHFRISSLSAEFTTALPLPIHIIILDFFWPPVFAFSSPTSCCCFSWHP